MTRAEHMRWAKNRALDYVVHGDLNGALASLLSDVSKHDDTRDLASFVMTLGPTHATSAASMRSFIDGFAE